MDKEMYPASKLKLIQNLIENSDLSPAQAHHSWLCSLDNEDIELEWAAESLVIYGRESISERQRGYWGKGWDDAWLVICDASADPFIINKTNGGVYFLRHGQGAWEMLEVAGSSLDFLKALQYYCNIYYERFNCDVLDETFEVKLDFLRDLESALESLLSEGQIKNFIFAIAG